MTLASQRVRGSRTGRSSRSSRFRRRKKQRNGRLVGGAVLAAIVLGGGWWVVSRIGGGPSPAGAAEPAAPAEAASEQTTPEKPRSEPPPPEIVMGAAAPPASNPVRSQPTAAQQRPVERPTVRPQQAAPSQQPESPEETKPQPTPAPPPSDPRPAAAEQPKAPASVVDVFLQRGRDDQKSGKLVQARQVYNAALFHPEATQSQKQLARALLSEVNQTLIFSPTVYEGDPLAEKYRVQSGDALSKIVPAHGLAIHYHFLVRINRMRDANSLQLGQPLKLVRGPFHAVVDKSEYRIDLYAGDPPPPGSAGNADGAEAGWLYIRSFPVGLGEGSGTPLGSFVIKNKDINPGWRNPRTGETFDRNDPKNPIGEHWLGLQGTDEQSAQYTGYGLHGTIEPESIGRDMSMGCVRMAADDIATVWEMLTEGVSVVRIRP